MLKRHEIQVLRRAGHTQGDVAKLAGVSVRSIRGVEDEAAVSHVSNQAEREKRRIGRPSYPRRAAKGGASGHAV